MSLPTNEGRVGRALRPRPTLDIAAPQGERETRRELAKLTATFLNGLGIAIVAVGALTPLATTAAGQPVLGSGLAVAATGLISVSAGAIFHLAARGILKREYRR